MARRIAATEIADRAADQQRQTRSHRDDRVTRTAKQPEDKARKRAGVDAALGWQAGKRCIGNASRQQVGGQGQTSDEIGAQPTTLIRRQPGGNSYARKKTAGSLPIVVLRVKRQRSHRTYDRSETTATCLCESGCRLRIGSRAGIPHAAGVASVDVRVPVARSAARTNVRRGLQLAVRASTAAGLSLAAAEAIQLPFPIYAMIAAVIVTDRSALQTRRSSVPRLVGTAIGTAAGAALAPLVGSGPAAMAVGILIAMFAGFLIREDAAKLSGYACGIVLLGFRESPWTYAWYRLLETALGIGMAVLVSMVPKLLADEETRDAQPRLIPPET